MTQNNIIIKENGMYHFPVVTVTVLLSLCQVEFIELIFIMLQTQYISKALVQILFSIKRYFDL